MEEIKDGYRLSTGREFYANNGIVGIAHRTPTADEQAIGIHSYMVVYEGFDGEVDIEPREWDSYAGWTSAERAELADFMIALWTQFKARP